LKGSGVFTVISCCYEAVLHSASTNSFPLWSIWGTKATKGVSFFVWTAAWGKILIFDLSSVDLP